MDILAQPRELAELTEIDPVVPAGTGDRFSGYCVLGLPFVSGHILAFRRYPASSLGYGYTSVWHRTPDGRWTFWSDNPPADSCARFFERAPERAAVAQIRVIWTGPRSLQIVVADGAVDWSLQLAATPATLLMGAVGAALPERAWQHPMMLGAMGRIAGPLLRLGKVRLTGRAVSGHRFMANPRQAWTVVRSAATAYGKSFGDTGPLSRQVFLGDFAIPQRGVFVIGRVRFWSDD